MDEKKTAGEKAETCPVHAKGPRIEQINSKPEQHPATTGMEQQANPVIDLYKQSPAEKRLVETLREDNKLLKAKLTGFEALAYLYQQSKNECANLKKLCTELSCEKDQFRKKHSISDIELLDADISPHCLEKNPLEATDPLGTLLEEKKLNLESSEAVGVQTLNLDDRNVGEVVQNEAFQFSGNQQTTRKSEETVELRSGEVKQYLAMGNGTVDDDSHSSFSYLEMQRSLPSSDDGIGNKNREKSHDLENSSEVAGNNHELFGSRELSAFHNHLMNPGGSEESKSFLRELLSVGIKLINLDEQMNAEENLERGRLVRESHRRRQTESSATQTLDQEILRCNHDQSNDLDQNCSSSDRRKSSVVTDDLITEVQILRQQVMTFKDDFDRERRDREKVRSKYDLLKSHFDRVSADFRDIKDQHRCNEIKLEESEKEKVALRHKLTKTANELKSLKRGSPTSSRTQFGPQRVPPLDVLQTWPCIHCTYLNPHQRKTCEMCGRAGVHGFMSPLQVP